ncbi:hypothetical protein TNCV_1779601 [Trichonephila clavipes]|nr:hypothetical protein TNCV_1779601 [Trichonephila clavipes]
MGPGMESLDWVQSGKADLAMPAVGITEERTDDSLCRTNYSKKYSQRKNPGKYLRSRPSLIRLHETQLPLSAGKHRFKRHGKHQRDLLKEGAAWFVAVDRYCHTIHVQRQFSVLSDHARENALPENIRGVVERGFQWKIQMSNTHRNCRSRRVHREWLGVPVREKVHGHVG